MCARRSSELEPLRSESDTYQPGLARGSDREYRLTANRPDVLARGLLVDDYVALEAIGRDLHHSRRVL